jgi:hypothetical protein
MKRGSSIYEQGCKTLDDKALTNGFSMTPGQTVVFVEALTGRATAMGWNAGSMQITTFANLSGKDVDIIKEYGQIDEVTLKTAAAQINTLTVKGHLKADKTLEDALDDDKKTRNKKNRGDKTRQKEDEARKKIPPKDCDEKSKKLGKHTFHWCEHHMAWCMHRPSECRLGNQRKEEQSPTAGGNSATYAAAAASFANPQFQALLASMQGRFNEG